MFKLNATPWLASALLVGASLGAQAGTVSWTDWTSATSTGVDGSLVVGASTVNVSFSGAYSFAQTSGGINYWNPDAPYLSSVVGNAPPASDIIALDQGGVATITFSQAVVDPLIALVSWNGNTVDFGVPIEVLSYGNGYWGGGIPVVNGSGTGFFGSGEVHGVIRLPGTYTSISFSHTSENWHGLTVGVVGLPVPEPETYALMLAGLAAMGLALRRRQT
jgi:hypothetical protein